MTPPYYAVIFTSLRTADGEGYDETADLMDKLAAQQPGYLGVEHSGAPGKTHITVSYWSSLEAIAQWRRHADHLGAQRNGRERWYQSYRLRVAKVERDSVFDR